jgi:hypothetical protein
MVSTGARVRAVDAASRFRLFAQDSMRAIDIRVLLNLSTEMESYVAAGNLLSAADSLRAAAELARMQNQPISALDWRSAAEWLDREASTWAT